MNEKKTVWLDQDNHEWLSDEAYLHGISIQKLTNKIISERREKELSIQN